MFGFRPDGKRVKKLTPIFRVIPSIMIDRADSQVYFKQDIPLKELDDYIDKKQLKEKRVTYMQSI